MRGLCVCVLQAIFALRGTGQHQEVNAATRAHQLFARCDVDRNGRLTEDEFVEGIQKDEFILNLMTADPQKF